MINSKYRYLWCTQAVREKDCRSVYLCMVLLSLSSSTRIVPSCSVFRPSFIFRQSFMRTFTDHICHALDSYAHKQQTNPRIGECAYVSQRREHTINIDIIMCLPCNHNQHIKYYHRWESACKHTHGEALEHTWNRHKLRCAFQCDEIVNTFLRYTFYWVAVAGAFMCMGFREEEKLRNEFMTCWCVHEIGELRNEIDFYHNRCCCAAAAMAIIDPCESRNNSSVFI